MKKEKQTERITNYPPLLGPMNMMGLFKVDPMGSYTGVPEDPEEKPIQDADDL